MRVKCLARCTDDRQARNNMRCRFLEIDKDYEGYLDDKYVYITYELRGKTLMRRYNKSRFVIIKKYKDN